jgi:predicted MFS family arabinose efflux permease
MGAVSRWLVPAIGLGILLNPLNSSMIAVALPRLQKEFGLDFGQVSWAVIIFYIVSAVAQPVIGRISDRWGRKRLFLVGLGTMFVASVAAAVSTQFGWLLAFRGLQALATSMVASVGLSIIRLNVVEKKAQAAATVSVFVSGAAAFGPAVGGFLLHWTSWTSIFWINVPFVAVSFALALRAIPADPPRLASAASPKGAFRLFFTRPLVLTNLEFILVNVVYYAFFFGFPTYLEGTRHLDSLSVGLLMLLVGVASLAASSVVGRWVEKSGPWPALLVSGALMAAAGVAAAFLGSGSPVAFIAVVLAAIGLAGGINNVGLQVALFRTSPPEISGLASGLFLTSRYGGTILASLLLDAAFSGPFPAMAVLSVGLVAATLIYLGLVFGSRNHLAAGSGR